MADDQKSKINCSIVSESSLCIFKDAKLDTDGMKCSYIKKFGHYVTAKGEIVQRYICLKSYRTFTMYTNDKNKSYMRNRNLPCEEISRAYHDNPRYTIAFLAEKYGVGISTIRTILKNYKKANI